jgi:flagellar protein FlgJ
MTVDQFINRTKNAAFAVSKKYGLNPFVTLAQSALETGWGKHAPGNMFFGIKAGSSWTGKKQLLTTKEFRNGKFETIQSWFRAYDTPEESFEDYAKLIKTKSWFNQALNHKDDELKYITEIQKGGYATDPNYITKIMSIVGTLKKKLS